MHAIVLSEERIAFKLVILVYKCVNNSAPSYLSDLISLQSEVNSSECRQRLRSSSDTTWLHVPRSIKSAGDASFQVAATKLWNDLPMDLRRSEPLSVFRGALKTYLFPV